MINPYSPTYTKAVRDQPEKPCDTSSVSNLSRKLSITCIALYCSAPFRDAMLLSFVQDHGGFPPDGDSIGFGIIASFISTIIMFPIVAAMVWRGIAGSTRVQMVPFLDRVSCGWGVFSTLVFSLVLFLEYEKLRYSLDFGFHRPLIALSIIYSSAAYLWWCCSLAHRRPMEIDPVLHVES